MPSKMPERLREAHDKHMSQPPTKYRGFTINPVSYAHAPYHLSGFGKSGMGYVLSDENGHGNMAPGATAYFTVEQVKRAIDCIHLAGGYGKPMDNSWVTTYWELAHETTRYGKIHGDSVVPEDPLVTAWNFGAIDEGP